MRKRVFFYVQHLLGIGHLRRAAAIARALVAAGAEVTFVSGGEPVPGIDLGGAELVQLPPASAADSGFSAIVDAAGRPVDAAWQEERCRQLLRLFADRQPEILLIEMYPFGRRQFRFELLPLLDAAGKAGKPPLIACSLRDILVDKGRPDRRAEALALVEQDARAVQALVDAGREPRLRAVQARSEVQAVLAQRDEAGALKQGALARLAAVSLWETPIQGVSGSLLDRLPAPVTARVDDPLAVRIAQAELETANRQVTLERRRALPGVSLSAGNRRFQASDDRAMTLGVQLSVPLFDRNRGGISAANADARAAEARLLAQQQESRADRLGAEAALAASHSRTRAADAGVEAAEEAYRLARVGFDAGRIAQLELRGARSALIAARLAAVDARMARVQAEIDLALLQGRAPFKESR